MQDGCRFCASTIGGLERNLTPSEMLGQIYQIQRISGERVANVVVMGTGEPLDNYDNLLKFIRMLTDEHGLHIQSEKPDGFYMRDCSENAGTGRGTPADHAGAVSSRFYAEKRKKLMPVANKYELSEVLEACDIYFEKTGRRMTFEYSLVHGVNDTEEDARELITLLSHKNCHINLIPVNPIKERDFERPTREAAEKFKNKLEKSGINVTIRREMGSDIDGACGTTKKALC